MPTGDLADSPTLPSLFQRLSAAVTATKMTNTELPMGHQKNHFIFLTLNYSHIILSASLSLSQDAQVCCYWDYFVLINSRETETAQIILFWARSNSAQHRMLPKQTRSLLLVPLGQQLIASHLKKPRYSPMHCSHHLGATIKPHTWHRTTQKSTGDATTFAYGPSNQPYAEHGKCLRTVCSASALMCENWQQHRHSDFRLKLLYD